MIGVVVGELNLDHVVVEEFGGSFALDLVAFFASVAAKADRVAGVFDLEDGLQGAKDDFAALSSDRQGRWSAEIEVSAIMRAISVLASTLIGETPGLKERKWTQGASPR